MAERQNSGLTSKSLLIDLLGGDYRAYGLQRERLRRIHSSRYGQSKQALAPKASLPGPPGVELPSVAVAAQKQSNVKQTNGRRSTSGKVSTFRNVAGGP
jgi:hypothetical protein